MQGYIPLVRSVWAGGAALAQIALAAGYRFSKFGGVPALTAIFILGIWFTAQAEEKPDSEQVSQLLSDIATQSFQLKADAFMLEYESTHSNVNSRARLEQVTKDISEAGRKLALLGELRPSASRSQAETVDRVQPLLKELIGNSEILIGSLASESKTVIAARASMSSDLASLIADFVSYGNSKQRVDRATNNAGPSVR
jgi:hypothetical protein